MITVLTKCSQYNHQRLTKYSLCVMIKEMLPSWPEWRCWSWWGQRCHTQRPGMWRTTRSCTATVPWGCSAGSASPSVQTLYTFAVTQTITPYVLLQTNSTHFHCNTNSQTVNNHPATQPAELCVFFTVPQSKLINTSTLKRLTVGNYLHSLYPHVL